jgi:hypothetical protein
MPVSETGFSRVGRHAPTPLARPGPRRRPAAADAGSHQQPGYPQVQRTNRDARQEAGGAQIGVKLLTRHHFSLVVRVPVARRNDCDRV